MNTIELFEILHQSRSFAHRDPFCVGASIWIRSQAIKVSVNAGDTTHIDQVARSEFDTDQEYRALIEYAKHCMEEKQLRGSVT